MSVNSMSIEDARALLNSIHQQVTGRTSIAATSTADFVSQATTTLQAGSEPVYSALMQVIARTIFAVRPYESKFNGLQADSARWGGIVRKVSFGDADAPADSAYRNLTDGTSVDPWTIHKTPVVETRFYGSDVYQDDFTTFEQQLYSAFRSEAEFGAFIAAQTQHMSNKWEQYREEMARMLLANLIAAKNVADSGSVLHLLTEYNALSGSSLTSTDIYASGTMEPFWKFVRARVNTIGRLMTARSEKFQLKLTGYNINRHTPIENQKMYILSEALDRINTMVNADTYHDEPLKYSDVEGVDFWQAINTPDQLSITPSYIGANGAVVTAPVAQTMTNVLGVIFDEDAIAYSVIDYSVRNSPLNQKGRYFNTNLTANVKYMNDLTEKAVVLLLD